MKIPIVVLFLFSSIQVLAEESPQKEEKIYTESEFQKAISEKVQQQVIDKLDKIKPANLTTFSKELLAKEQKLKERELLVESKERELELNMKNFESRVREQEKSLQHILGCLDENKKDTQKRMDHLVSVVSSMKPKTAADVLATQEPDISVRILGSLEAEKVAKIFNLMEKETSARLQKQYLNMKR